MRKRGGKRGRGSKTLPEIMPDLPNLDYNETTEEETELPGKTAQTAAAESNMESLLNVAGKLSDTQVQQGSSSSKRITTTPRKVPLKKRALQRPQNLVETQGEKLYNFISKSPITVEKKF